MKNLSNLSRRDMLALSMKASLATVAATQMPFAFANEKMPYGSAYSYNPDFKYLRNPATVFDFGLTPDQEEHAKELHKSIVVYDALMECSYYEDLVKLSKLGGLTAGHMSLGITGLNNFRPDQLPAPDDWWSWENLVRDMAFIQNEIRGRKDAMICTSHADIMQAHKTGQVGFIPTTQNIQFMGRDTSKINEAYAMGLRAIQLTYNPSNMVGSGSLELPERRFGLSELGHRAVGTMNDLGMIVDTGHCSPETMIAAANASSDPIIISHAGMQSKIKQFRATTDEALRVVADKGGVAGVISVPAAIAGSDKCTVNDYLDNIEHAINVAGIDHVGFGSDFIIAATFEAILSAPSWDPAVVAQIGSFEVWPWSDGHVGYENTSAYPNLTRGLIARGYSDEDIAKVMGGNFLRVFKEVVG
ncbi:membrane dipeptidase [Thalassotalea psychrophila]|uniref:Membrane dipeptidase n=1 Tax=Thalassotalea psychrophila TaxID=3065647 RepID=A0ABY9U128_9GAMM|nr:membrane dipeptidase [Colwelliaceae bacterium SQ149]